MRVALMSVCSVALALLAGCGGARSEVSDPRLRTRTASTRSAVGALLRSRGPEPEQCTATLVAPNIVLTASHCLALRDRLQGGACDDTWVVLPASDGRPRETVACAAVLYATTLAGLDALEPDVALLRLAGASSRAPLALDTAPLGEGTFVTVLSVTAHPIYATTQRRVTRRCRVMGAGVATSMLGPAAAAVGWLNRCDIASGNSGSPVLDEHGAVRAVVHGGTPRGFGVTTPMTAALVRALARASSVRVNASTRIDAGPRPSRRPSWVGGRLAARRPE